MTKKIVWIISIIVVSIILVIISVRYANYRMKLSEINDKLSETIGKDQGLMEIILKIPQTEITYGEVFDLCSKSVEERNKLIIELRGLYPNMENKIKDTLIDFLSIENELVRERSQMSRREMNLKSYQDRIGDLESSEYSYYYSSSIRTLRKEALEDGEKYLISRLSFSEKYNILLSKENNLFKMMKDAGLRFMLMYTKYKDINLPKETSKIDENKQEKGSIKFNGYYIFYNKKSDDYMCLRFFEDSVVVGQIIAREGNNPPIDNFDPNRKTNIIEVSSWLNKNYKNKGKYTISGINLSFYLTYRKTINYTGTIKGNGNLILKNNSTDNTYYFVSIA